MANHTARKPKYGGIAFSPAFGGAKIFVGTISYRWITKEVVRRKEEREEGLRKSETKFIAR